MLHWKNVFPSGGSANLCHCWPAARAGGRGAGDDGGLQPVSIPTVSQPALPPADRWPRLLVGVPRPAHTSSPDLAGLLWPTWTNLHPWFAGQKCPSRSHHLGVLYLCQCELGLYTGISNPHHESVENREQTYHRHINPRPGRLYPDYTRIHHAPGRAFRSFPTKITIDFELWSFCSGHSRACGLPVWSVLL